ncbi:MAG: cysteine desulfurase [Corynebacteriales bacterium]|nr:cysteine desulfurase [Mycobacteriales bacterium]
MVYLDHAATTPMLPQVKDAFFAAMDEYGNPSSLHAKGRAARRRVEEAREDIAAALGARPSEIIFTGTGTESDNLAVKGIYWARKSENPERDVIIASPVEHHAVLDALEWLHTHEGAYIHWLSVDEYGRVSPDAFADALSEYGARVALATVMWANNEVGTIQPISELTEAAKLAEVPFHTDAVQAISQLPVAFDTSGAQALTLTAHKIGGPHSVAALILSKDTKCAPLLHGGGQERQVRSGTLDTASIVAMGVAVRHAVDNQSAHAADVAALRDELVAGVRAQVPEAILQGDPVHRLPGNAYFSFPGCEGDALLMLLDAQGIQCSTGSACTAGVPQPSHVLLAMGKGPILARSSIRFSLGHTSTTEDVAALISVLPRVVERARSATASHANMPG